MSETPKQRIDFSQAITAEDKAAAADEALRERIRKRRDRAVAAGIVVGGIEVHTDDVSQQRILGAAVAVMRDPTLRINWEARGGRFVALDAEAVSRSPMPSALMCRPASIARRRCSRRSRPAAPRISRPAGPGSDIARDQTP